MYFIELNYLALLVAAVAAMAIGFIWYARPLFGKAWMDGYGLEATEEAKAKTKKKLPVIMLGMIVLTLLMIYVLAHFVQYAGANDWMSGAATGLWVWIGFVVTLRGMNFLFAQRPFKIFAIEAGADLVTLLVAGAIIGGWQ